MGVRPTTFDEKTLRSQQDAVRQVLESEEPQIALFANPRSAVAFQELFLIRDETRLPRQFQFFLYKWVPALRRWLAPILDDYRIDVLFDTDNSAHQKWRVSQAGDTDNVMEYDV